jgi:hypothetical protein
MGVNFYLAGGSETDEDRLRVECLRDALVRKGWSCTYDWMAEYKLVPIEVACQLERMGVQFAQVVVGLVPGYRGTWWELGMADAWGKPILCIRFKESDDDNMPFYWQEHVRLVECFRGVQPVENWADQVADLVWHEVCRGEWGNEMGLCNGL